MGLVLNFNPAFHDEGNETLCVIAQKLFFFKDATPCRNAFLSISSPPSAAREPSLEAKGV